MLRVILLGVLVASSGLVGACGKSAGGPPAVNSTASVGKVTELSGKVEAVRAGKTRPLAVDAEVFADDEIVTGADGSVAIVLAHNNGTYRAEANHRAKLAETAVWAMAKLDKPEPTQHATAAAGREGERQAASTTATAGATAAPPQEVPEAAAAPQSGGEAEKQKQKTPRTEATRADKPAKDDADEDTEQAPLDDVKVDHGPAAPRVDVRAGGGGGAGAGAGAGAGQGGGSIGGKGAPPPGGPATDASALGIVLGKRAVLAKCPHAAGAMLEVHVVNGKATATGVADPAGAKCVNDELAKLKLAANATMTMTLKL